MKHLLFLLFAIPVWAMAQGGVQFVAPGNVTFNYGVQNIAPLLERDDSVEVTVEPNIFTLGGCNFLVPQGAPDLNSGFEFKYSILSSDANGSLSVLGFGGASYGKKTTHVVIEFMQKRAFVCQADTAIFGAGLVALLTIEKKGGKIDVTNLPQVAANVTMGKMKASYSVRTVGITGPVALQALPSNFEFDTESYKEFFKVVDLIKRLYEEDPAQLKITPQLLPKVRHVAPESKKGGKGS